MGLFSKNTRVDSVEQAFDDLLKVAPLRPYGGYLSQYGERNPKDAWAIVEAVDGLGPPQPWLLAAAAADFIQGRDPYEGTVERLKWTYAIDKERASLNMFARATGNMANADEARRRMKASMKSVFKSVGSSGWKDMHRSATGWLKGAPDMSRNPVKKLRKKRRSSESWGVEDVEEIKSAFDNADVPLTSPIESIVDVEASKQKTNADSAIGEFVGGAVESVFNQTKGKAVSALRDKAKDAVGDSLGHTAEDVSTAADYIGNEIGTDGGDAAEPGDSNRGRRRRQRRGGRGGRRMWERDGRKAEDQKTKRASESADESRAGEYVL